MDFFQYSLLVRAAHEDFSLLAGSVVIKVQSVQNVSVSAVVADGILSIFCGVVHEGSVFFLVRALAFLLSECPGLVGLSREYVGDDVVGSVAIPDVEVPLAQFHGPSDQSSRRVVNFVEPL